MKSSLDSTSAWEGGTGTGECENQTLLSSSNGDSSSSRVQVSGVGIEDGPVAGEDAESPNDARGLRAPTKGLLFKLKAIELAKRPGGQVRGRWWEEETSGFGSSGSVSVDIDYIRFDLSCSII